MKALLPSWRTSKVDDGVTATSGPSSPAQTLRLAPSPHRPRPCYPLHLFLLISLFPCMFRHGISPRLHRLLYNTLCSNYRPIEVYSQSCLSDFTAAYRSPTVVREGVFVSICTRTFPSEMGGEKDLTVAQNVDLTRYQGRWYEIASMPSRFQPSTGSNSRATYALKEDQTIDVLNETWLDGKRSYIHGTAWKVDPASPDAKLKVRFVVPPFLPIFPVTGDYWVMKLDENYQWALVGQPSRKFLWVLSRTPELSEDLYKELLDHATNEGYDVSKLQKTAQLPGVGEDGNSSNAEDNSDKVGIWWLKSLFGK